MTTITQVITALPTAPDPATMSPSAFSTAAAASVLAQKAMTPELNTMAGQMNTVAGEVNIHATTATTQAGIATTQAGIATTQAGNALTSANNAATSAASALSAPGTNATSTTSMTVSTGSKAFTLAQTGKTFVVGQWVSITDSATPTANWMLGAITAFTTGTGAITVLPYTLAGTLTGTSWVIAAAAPPTIGGLPVTVVTGTTQTAVAGNFYLMTNAAASTVTMPATPVVNDQVGAMFTNGLYTNSFARNGKTFYGDALDFQVNAGVLLPWKWQYFSTILDWRQTV